MSESGSSGNRSSSRVAIVVALIGSIGTIAAAILEKRAGERQGAAQITIVEKRIGDQQAAIRDLQAQFTRRRCAALALIPAEGEVRRA